MTTMSPDLGAVSGDRTKARVLSLLKSRRGSTAQTVADTLSISVPAARRHLSDLTDAGLVASEVHRPGGRGRPQHVYSLSERGEAAFPKSYGTLCVDVLAHVQELYGSGAVMQVMDRRRARLHEQWSQNITGTTRERAQKLTEILGAAGYAARLTEEDGALYLHQGNCPGLDVAKQYSELCTAELTLYRDLLGVPVHRETRIACGAPTCRYRIG